MSRHPEVKWAQRVDKVYITIQLPDAKNAKVNLEPDGVFSFSATAGAENNSYEVKLNLFDKVNVEESKINTGVRSIFCVVEKVEKVWWKKLLRGNEKPPHFLKIDWDKWADEDEDSGTGDLDFGGMDFSKFGGMEGMGGDMGGDMGDELDDDDTDDEEQVTEKGEAAENADVVEKAEEAPGVVAEPKETAAST